jgi:hypothetical protein
MMGPDSATPLLFRTRIKGREEDLKHRFDEDKFDEYKEVVKQNAKVKAERRATLEHVGRNAFRGRGGWPARLSAVSYPRNTAAIYVYGWLVYRSRGPLRGLARWL